MEFQLHVRRLTATETVIQRGKIQFLSLPFLFNTTWCRCMTKVISIQIYLFTQILSVASSNDLLNSIKHMYDVHVTFSWPWNHFRRQMFTITKRFVFLFPCLWIHSWFILWTGWVNSKKGKTQRQQTRRVCAKIASYIWLEVSAIWHILSFWVSWGAC